MTSTHICRTFGIQKFVAKDYWSTSVLFVFLSLRQTTAERCRAQYMRFYSAWRTQVDYKLALYGLRGGAGRPTWSLRRFALNRVLFLASCDYILSWEENSGEWNFITLFFTCLFKIFVFLKCKLWWFNFAKRWETGGCMEDLNIFVVGGGEKWGNELLMKLFFFYSFFFNQNQFL